MGRKGRSKQQKKNLQETSRKNVTSSAFSSTLQPAAIKFAVGDYVKLKEMKTDGYNGRHGRVVSLPTTHEEHKNEGRYGIHLDGRAVPIAIRGRNLALTEFKKSDYVTLKDLEVGRYNGRQGRVVSLRNEEPGTEGRYVIHLDGEAAAIAVQGQNLVLADHRRSSTSTEEQSRQRDRNETRPEGVPDANQMEMMRMMTNLLMTEENQVQLYGRKIKPMPNFYEEVTADGGGIPEGVSKTWGVQYLRTSFEKSYHQPQMDEMYIKNPEFEVKDVWDIVKRLGSNEKPKVAWYYNPSTRPGDIYPRDMYPYSQYIRHSFSNQQYRKEMLDRGKTHVAVGFVDLGVLFAATVRESNAGPLRFLGIEMSAYAVAKTLVIWEMLKQTPAVPLQEGHLRCVMQAWFSASWGDETYGATKAALKSLCSNAKEPYHSDVWELLQHWHQAPALPMNKTRKSYSATKKADSPVSCISDLERKCDRIAMAKYELTGDIGLQGKPTCGNILTFDCPDGTPPIARNETVFSALNLEEMTQCWSNGTILEAAESYIMVQLSKVADWATRKVVEVDLVCAKVEDKVPEIAAANPWTMSWSNLPDYINYADFHRIARACSAQGDTIHFAYSMNWTCDVYGTNIMDYAGKELAKFRATVLDGGNEQAKQVYQLMGWERYLRLPPAQNPLNTSSHFFLEFAHFRKWADYFFHFAKRSGPCQTCDVEHVVGSPLSPTGGSTVAFTWTYNPDIRLTGTSR